STHFTCPTPRTASHELFWANGVGLVQLSGVRKTARRGPFEGGVKTIVTTWSLAFAPSTCEGPSHPPGRTLTSTKSPGAANGLFVAPTVPRKVCVADGIRLHAACAVVAAKTAPATTTRTRAIVVIAHFSRRPEPTKIGAMIKEILIS